MVLVRQYLRPSQSFFFSIISCLLAARSSTSPSNFYFIFLSTSFYFFSCVERRVSIQTKPVDEVLKKATIRTFFSSFFLKRFHFSLWTSAAAAARERVEEKKKKEMCGIRRWGMKKNEKIIKLMTIAIFSLSFFSLSKKKKSKKLIKPCWTTRNDDAMKFEADFLSSFFSFLTDFFPWRNLLSLSIFEDSTQFETSHFALMMIVNLLLYLSLHLT